MKYGIKVLLSAMLMIMAASAAAKDPTYKPFVLASASETSLEEKTQEVITALAASGFEIVGRYAPVQNSNVLVVTSDELKAIAAGSERGGYAAGQRISVSEVNGRVEVVFVNPEYIQHAYWLEGDMRGVYEQLTSALGHDRYCGAGNKKMTAKKLHKYNYMMGMQRFDDPSELGSFDSYEAAIAAVENGLAREGDGLTQIYRIDIPGKNQSVFGVGMKSTGEDDKNIDEAFQSKIVDFEGCLKRAYFPYEVLVNGNEVEALHMRFRMAVHFPNLSMMGKHGFTKLMPFPGAIEDALEKMVNAQ